MRYPTRRRQRINTTVNRRRYVASKTLAAPSFVLTPGVGTIDVDYTSGGTVDMRWRRVFPSGLPSLTTQASAPWQLRRIDGEGDSDYAQRYTGDGVLIYLVDSGVNGDHLEFDGRVLTGASASGQNGEPVWTSPDPWDDEVPHGTGCASLAIGELAGVAKGATLYPVKVGGVWTGGGGLTEDIYNIPPGPGTDHEGTEGLTIEAYEWAYQHILAHYRNLPAGTRAVISDSTTARSYTGPGALPLEAARLEAAVQACIDAGIPVYCLAQNFNQAIDHVPALMADVITCGGVDENDDRFVTGPDTGSNFGPSLDLFAPAAADPAVGVADNVSDTTYWTGGGYGTSSSTPITAGCGALLLQQNPRLTPARLKQVQTAQAFAGVVDLAGATSTVNLLVNSLASTSEWTEVSGISDGYDLDGLEWSTGYEIQLRQTVSGSTSAWSSTTSATTLARSRPTARRRPALLYR